MNQRQMFALGFFVVLLILLYQIAIVFRPFLLPVLWAVILAHMTFPLHRRAHGLAGPAERIISRHSDGRHHRPGRRAAGDFYCAIN